MEHSLVRLLLDLLVHILLRVLSIVAKSELGESKEHDDETVVTNGLESKVAGGNEHKWALKELGQLPDEIPNFIGVAHNDRADFSFREVFIGGTSHPKVLLEEDCLETSVCSVAYFDHLEAEVLPSRVHDHAHDRKQKHRTYCLASGVGRVWGRVLEPRDETGHQERLVDIPAGEEGADGAELQEVPLIGLKNSLHEGISILWVLLDVVLDVGLDNFGLMANSQAIWKLSILLELDLLSHGTV